MILEKVSTFGHEETVKKITDATRVGEWVVSGVKQLDKSILKNGGPKVLPVTLVEICNAEHAGKILLDDSSRWASVMMPCTLTVYNKNDGKTSVGFMNAQLIGHVRWARRRSYGRYGSRGASQNSRFSEVVS